jgi:hypothetical protein
VASADTGLLPADSVRAPRLSQESGRRDNCAVGSGECLVGCSLNYGRRETVSISLPAIEVFGVVASPSPTCHAVPDPDSVSRKIVGSFSEFFLWPDGSKGISRYLATTAKHHGAASPSSLQFITLPQRARLGGRCCFDRYPDIVCAQKNHECFVVSATINTKK